MMLSAFIIRPSGVKQGIDFDRVERELIDPALNALDIVGRTSGDSLKQGNLRTGTFQHLLTADVVIVDISIAAPNVFYELGIRHALREKRTYMIRSSTAELLPDEMPFAIRTDRYLSYDASQPALALETLTEGLREMLDSGDGDSPVFESLPELIEHDGSCFLAVPKDFLEEVRRAGEQEQTRHQWGDLKLLQTEVRGFEWEVEGLRVVGRVQLHKQAYEHARDTWALVRASDPHDKEASTWLATISRRLGNHAESSGALNALPDAELAGDEPPHVLLFTGHRIDAQRREKPRFPASKEGLARAAIKETITKEAGRVGGRVTGIAGGASGGDILFHEVCAELNIKTTLYLALPRDGYVKASVADGGKAWVDRFDALYKRLPRRELGTSKELPRWLQSKPDYNIWQRNNLWSLYNAMALGGSYVTLIALWDGAAGDGAGGTQDMVDRADESGAKTIILPTKEIFNLG